MIVECLWSLSQVNKVYPFRVLFTSDMPSYTTPTQTLTLTLTTTLIPHYFRSECITIHCRIDYLDGSISCRSVFGVGARRVLLSGVVDSAR